MPNARGTVTIGGTAPLTDGITQTSTGNAIVGIDRKTTDLLFDHAAFGVSVTRLDETDVQSWAVEVYSDIGGFDKLIAGISGIGTTTSSVIPIVNAAGATQHEFIGIPIPTSVDIVGSSTAVGTTFGCVVTLNLHNSGR